MSQLTVHLPARRSRVRQFAEDPVSLILLKRLGLRRRDLSRFFPMETEVARVQWS
jgi:hypothetical protein